MRKKQTIDAMYGQKYERSRINAFTRYRIVGAPNEEIFDHFVQMAALIFHVPGAIIAFVAKICTLQSRHRYRRVYQKLQTV